MHRIICAAVASVLLSAPVTAQERESAPQLVLLARGATNGAHVGAQLEFNGLDHVAPWISVKYGKHVNECARLCGEDGWGRGFSVMTGVRIRRRAGDWEPYLSLGAGVLRLRYQSSELTGTAQVGAMWTGFDRVRPRMEVGYEGQGSGVSLGLGILL